RGGTSKGVFFSLTDLPAAAQVAVAERDSTVMLGLCRSHIN
ncbi:MAG TPA: hypothetical protein DDW91_17435, partial [Shewanella frigidimarina]|nr:hypothetical protein [Shewanella frigidimarina]